MLNQFLYAQVLKTPLRREYQENVVLVDIKNKQIRSSGCWFHFNEKWVLQLMLFL